MPFNTWTCNYHIYATVHQNFKLQLTLLTLNFLFIKILAFEKVDKPYIQVGFSKNASNAGGNGLKDPPLSF